MKKEIIVLILVIINTPFSVYGILWLHFPEANGLILFIAIITFIVDYILLTIYDRLDNSLYPLTILKLFYLGIYLLFILITLSYIFEGKQSLNATNRDFLLYTSMILIFIVIDTVFRFYNKFSSQNDISGALKSFILYFYLSFIVLIFYRVIEGREILEGVQFQLFIIFTILILISGIDTFIKKVKHDNKSKL